MKQLFLKAGKDESLRRLHPWVFSGAVHHCSEQPADGEVVEVYSSTPRPDHSGFDHRFIATGHYQNGSIMVRVLSFSPTPINQTFYEQRLASALQMRRTVGLVPQTDDNNAYRLVHGEGDNLPGLVIDIYKRTAVMQAHSVGMHRDRRLIAGALRSVMGDTIDSLYYKSETTLPQISSPADADGFLFGGTTDDVAAENGLRFHVDWLKGQKTGFFVDQRDNRALLQHYASGRDVLNMFCYTGGFSLYALRGGARLVHSVDSSPKAIDLTNANVSLNFPGDPRHAAFAQDAFRFLSQSAPGAYDLIILDPPAFAKHRDALHNALKGYSRLNQQALAQIRPGGILFTFSCSQAVTKDHFRAAVFTAAAQAHRQVRILHQLHQPPDHPVSIFHPEGEYLKGLVLYVE